MVTPAKPGGFCQLNSITKRHIRKHFSVVTLYCATLDQNILDASVKILGADATSNQLLEGETDEEINHGAKVEVVE